MRERIYVGTRKGLFVLARGLQGWSIEVVHFVGEPVTMVLANAVDRTLYATLTLGHFGAKLRRLPDGASEWQELAVPVYPAGAEINDGPPVGDEAPKRKAASLAEIWALESGGPDQSGILWAGTIPGGLFKSEDSGQTWSLVESLWSRGERWKWFGGGKDDPGIHSILVDPRDSQRVTLGVSCGGVWQTTDGGQSWNCHGEGLFAEFMPPNLARDPAIQDPHRIACCTADPNTIWMQHHNGEFLSRDGGVSWRELTTARPSSFGFAVAAHPTDRQTAWFVPAADDQCRVPADGRMVVSRTRDGGESFEVLTRGLPKEHAYDIVYRHAFDVDPLGQTLAMGSTTGGLWVSENAGDDWTCVSHNLPPIYCVRHAVA